MQTGLAARIELNGKTYHLNGNDNGNNLHSGMDFYNIRIWETEEVTETSVRFKLHSPDGDQGYPGTADIYVTYSLDKDDKLDIFYEALSDKDTILNMTNHSYFNLDGHNTEVYCSIRLLWRRIILLRGMHSQYRQERFFRWRIHLWIFGKEEK